MNLTTMNSNDLETLEKLIDRYGLSTVLEGISEICYEKADHLIENWNDEHQAYSWEKSAAQIERMNKFIYV